MCDVFYAAQIHLEPLIMIIVFCRPGSAKPITCLKVQSPLYGRFGGTPLGRSRNLSVGDRVAFHSKRSSAFFTEEKTAKQRVKNQRTTVRTVPFWGREGGEVFFWRLKLWQWTFNYWSIEMFPSTLSRETSRFEGNQNYFSKDQCFIIWLEYKIVRQ